MFRILCFIALLSFSFGIQPEEHIWVDDFNGEDLDGWHGRRPGYEDIYSISSGDSTRVLHARSLDSDNFIIKKIRVDIVQYPYLNWRWKALSLPDKGDESRKKTCDVAASVNVILKASKWKPKTIKYSWSTTVEPDSCFRSPFSMWPARADVRVTETGDTHLNKWVTEKVNVLEDYKRLYRKKKLKSFVIEAIVIMTDSDNTGTLSEAEYDDIYFSRN